MNLISVQHITKMNDKVLQIIHSTKVFCSYKEQPQIFTCTSNRHVLCRSNCSHTVNNNNINKNNNRIPRRNLRFSTISSLCRELSPTRTLKWPRRNRVQITCNTSSADHMQHVLHATWYEGTVQLLSLTE